MLKYCAANNKEMAFSVAKRRSIYIYDISISGFTRSSIYIHDISSLRVKIQEPVPQNWEIYSISFLDDKGAYQVTLTDVL